MAHETHDLAPRPKTLDELLAECIAAEESGRAIDREALLRQHPEHAAELREFLANRDQMQRLAEPLLAAAQPASGGRNSGHALGKVRYFGDYELLEEIAAGGMGIVYKARQVSLNRIVAVKMILKGTLAGEDDVKRFRAEAEAAANLQHSGIVAIHEVGLHEGQHYFSMDFVEGQSLAQLPRESPLSARQAAEYVRDAADAVHYAHQQGTLHRDLKPSNILIDRQGRVRITDFGLAKRIEGNSDLTLTGQVLGTPSYMPPEQALGKRSLIGTASDVYSLGAVLYELLTGRPPFRGESPGETLRQVEMLEPVAPRLLSPTTPRDLETICLKCLEKEPHKRYLTAQHLADDVGRFLRHEPIVARPSRIWHRGMKWVRRHPTAAGLAVMSVVAMLALVAVVVSRSYNDQLQRLNVALEGAKSNLESQNGQLQSAKARLEAGNQQLVTTSGQLANALEQVSAERGKARRYLYAARMALAQQADQENKSGRVVQVLRSVIPQDREQEDLRDFEWFHLWRKHHGEELQFRARNSRATALAFTPDDKWIVSGGDDGTITLVNAETGVDGMTLRGPSHSVTAIGATFDNDILISASADNSISVWNLDSGELTQSVHFAGRGQVIALTIEAPNSSVTAISDLGEVERWDFCSGKMTSQSDSELLGYRDDVARSFKNRYSHHAFGATGTRIVEGDGMPSGSSAQVHVMDLHEKVAIPSREFTAPVAQVACSPDGSTIAAACMDLSIHVWEATTGADLCNLNVDSDVRSLAINTEGSQVVAGTEDGVLMVWSIPGNADKTIRKGKGRVNCVSFGASGRLIAAACNNAKSWDVKVWDVYSGQEVGGFSLAKSGNSRIELSHIGNWIAGTQLGGRRDVFTGRQVDSEQAKQPIREGYGIAISQDETQVAVATATANKVEVHSATTGIVRTIPLKGVASCVAFSPDGTLVAAGSGFPPPNSFGRGQLKVCNTATGEDVFPHEFVRFNVWGLAFSPDGTLLAAAMGSYQDHGANSGRVCVWETSSWRTILDLRGHSGCVWSVAFHPSGRRLASAGACLHKMPSKLGHSEASYWPGEVIIWDVVTGQQLLKMQDEKGGVFGVAFSPDGRKLAIGTQAGEVKLLNGTPLAETPVYEPLPDAFLSSP